MSEREFALKDFCRDEESFRKCVGRLAEADFALKVLRGDFSRGGFRFDDATLRRYAMVLSAIDELIRTGRVIFDQGKYDREVSKTLADAGLDDSAPEDTPRPAPLLRVVK
ncbi:MAG: hypothetical protein H3C59_01805 [Burkholderiaceae bacterium]|nr:hypothetical protein [Burkholderiaceae bacterium]